jgi:hypothetical protein
LKDHFLVAPGEWTGSGFISFSKIQERLPFTVNWSVAQLDEFRTRAIQRIVLEDNELTINAYVVVRKSDADFELLLENKDLGVFSGKGVFEPSQIAWEFTHFGTLEGIERYQRQSEHQYVFTAEYTGGEGYTTKIEGTLQQNP